MEADRGWVKGLASCVSSSFTDKKGQSHRVMINKIIERKIVNVWLSWVNVQNFQNPELLKF